MFWRFGGYANISTLDSILDKPDFTLEEILDDTDLIQELKQHNTKLIEYLRDENILRRLFQYVIAPPIDVPDEDEDERDPEEEEEEEEEQQQQQQQQQQQPGPTRRAFGGMGGLGLNRNRDATKTKKHEEREALDKQEKNRLKYAYASCEILSSEIWSVMEAMLEAKDSLRTFWSFLERDAPLDPVTAGYFSKIVDPLLDKKTAEMTEFIKEYGNFVPLVLKHIDTPNIMDVLLKIISIDKQDGGAGVIEWLHDQDLMPSLLSFVGKKHPTSTQIAAGDFIKAIVTISANASQNEQQCIGPNSLTRQLVSEPCVTSLINDMLEGGNPLTVGVGIVIEVIRKNNSDYDPEVGGGPEAAPSSGDPIYLGTLLRSFADNVPNFTALLMNKRYTLATHESTGGKEGRALKAAFGKTIEPLGFDRFKACELMAELLHCSNMGLLNEKGSDSFVKHKDNAREKLRAEGKLTRAHSGTSEDERSYSEKEDSDTVNVQADQTRKLEVTNSAEDDEFEELGTSAELEEQTAADRFSVGDDTTPEVQRIKPSESRLSLDDEFFDEPLSSPKLEPASVDTEPPSSQAPEAGEGAGTEKEEHAAGAQGEADGKTTSEQLVDAIESQLGPASLGGDPPPPLPERQANLVPPASEGGQAKRDVSPHPEDKPAPLFSGKSGAETKSNPETASEGSWTDVEKSVEKSVETDTTPPDPPAVEAEGEAVANPGELEKDVDGRPLVGDYLKMMFVEHKVIPTILDFFFRFPWNNFLHNVVYDVVQQVFNGPMDHGYNRFLAVDLFETGKITDRIIEGQLRSDEAQAHNHMRLGYMGHLTLIAEEVVKFSERHPFEVLMNDIAVKSIGSKIWSDYVDNTLAETRDRDNTILGGVRPDVGGSRQAVLNAVNSGGFSAGSSSLTAGLGGGNETGDTGSGGGGGGGAGLASGGGSLLSGFGSSSDEEDDEMEEIGEHDDGSGSRNDQYPAYAPSSLSALSIFSPSKEGTEGEGEEASGDGMGIPPPLNIPPSRARRQLAARLARHSNHGSGDAETGTTTLSDDAATSLSAAFNSIQLAGSEQDDSDPWAAIGQPASSNNGARDEGLDWLMSAQRANSSGQQAQWESFNDDGYSEDVPIHLALGGNHRDHSEEYGSELGPESSGSDGEDEHGGR